MFTASTDQSHCRQEIVIWVSTGLAIALPPERGISLGGYTDFTPIGGKITVISSEVKNTIIAESPESVVFQGAGVIIPDGLVSLSCVGLMCRSGEEKQRMFPLFGLGFGLAAQRCI